MELFLQMLLKYELIWRKIEVIRLQNDINFSEKPRTTCNQKREFLILFIFKKNYLRKTVYREKETVLNKHVAENSCFPGGTIVGTDGIEIFGYLDFIFGYL